MIGRESWDEGGDQDEREMDWTRGGNQRKIGREGIGGGRESSRWYGQHDGEKLSEVEIALIAVIEGDAQMSSFSVETSWSWTRPSYHCRPNFIRTLRPMKR